MENIRRKKTYYHNKLNRNLCCYLILNCLFYFIFSQRASNLNISQINYIIGSIRDIFSFNYEFRLFSIINFLLISFTAIKILFLAKRIPIFLILILSFILTYDSFSIISLPIDNIFSIVFFDWFSSSTLLSNILFRSDYALENIHYSSTLVFIIYSLIKKVLLGNIEYFIIKYNNFNKTYTGNNNNFNNSNYSSNSNNNHVDTCDYYDAYEYYNKGGFFKEKIFRITNSFDKKEIYDKRHTNAYDKVIDESGIEKYVWQYANDYEHEKRLEEDRRLQEEQNFYNNHYNNSSYNYNPYEDNSYESNNWSNNDSYYNNDDNSWY